MKVDSVIVQFIRTAESRALVGKFVWVYFNRPYECPCSYGQNSEHEFPLSKPNMLALDYGSQLIDEVLKPDSEYGCLWGNINERQCSCSIPALYLQWEGHSVTVVGIKRTKHDNGQPPSYTLLVFCPQKKVTRTKSWMAKELMAEKAVPTNEFKDEIIQQIIELPASTLVEKDCQILVSTAHVINEEERERRKHCSLNLGYLDVEPPGMESMEEADAED